MLNAASGSSIPTVIVVGVFALLTNHAKDPLSNTDTYFHLRFGHEFLTGNWSLTDPGSVTTFGTNDWVPTQWLPQVVMAQVEDWFGLAGVAWLSGLMYLALALTLWVDRASARQSPRGGSRHRRGDPRRGRRHVDAAAGAQLPPHRRHHGGVAGHAARTSKVRWWLVPLAWVWAMVHGMWPVGIIIGLVALVGIALDRAVTRRVWLRLAAIPLLSIVVAGADPRRARRCTPRCSRSTREASTSRSGSRRTSRDADSDRAAGPGRRRCSSACCAASAVVVRGPSCC